MKYYTLKKDFTISECLNLFEFGYETKIVFLILSKINEPSMTISEYDVDECLTFLGDEELTEEFKPQLEEKMLLSI